MSIPHLFNGKDKLFFMAYFEDLNDHQFVQIRDSVATQDMIAGNFSDGMPDEYNIYWPASQDWTAGQKSACQISSGGSYDPTTGKCEPGGTPNVIPTADVSALAQTLLKFLPLPSNGPNCTPMANAASEEIGFVQDSCAFWPGITQSTQFGTRVDYAMNSRSIIFGRVSWEDDLSIPAAAFGPINEYVTNTTSKQIVFGNTFTISPTKVNEFRAGWDYFYNDQASPYANGSFDPQATIGITGLVAHGAADYGYPSISSGTTTGFGGATPYITRDNIYSYTDTVSIIHGNNSFKVGGLIEWDDYNEIGNLFGLGALSEGGNATLDPALGSSAGVAAGGMGIASMELGLVDGEYLRISALSNVELRAKKYAGFLQDDWKARPNVTFNLGIRYDNMRPWVDKHDNFWNVYISGLGVTESPNTPYTEPLSTIVGGAEGVGSAAGTNSSVPPPIYTRPGASGCNFYGTSSDPATLEFGEPGQPVQCGDQYMGRATMNPNNENFGPRAGIDWALGTKTSIRAGFGIYYVSDQNEASFDMGRNLGGKDGTPSGVQDVYVPLAAPWSAETGSTACGPNAYNGGVAWTGVCELPGTAFKVGSEAAGTSGPQFQALGQNNRTPYVEQFLFDVQRQLSKNTALEVGYSGNESHHDLRDFIYNSPIPRTGPTDSSNPVQRRPWEQIGNIQAVVDWDRGAYNAMGVKLEQHVSHGLLYTVSFTWGHSIDFGSAYRDNAGDTLWPSNSYWQWEERGNSQFNQLRRLVGSFTYDLPFGQGKDFAPSNPIVNHIVSGWVAGGILTFASGLSISPSGAGDPSDVDQQGTMPEYQGIKPFKNPHPGIGGGISAPYWNPAAFDCAYVATPVSYCSTPGYTNQSWQAGNWRRGTLYAPGLENVDANVGRTFHIWESHTLLIRLEAFNSTNHVNWSTPASTNPSSATFGEITTTTEPMRELQGVVKYSF